MTLQALIDKADNLEVVRDRITELLVLEVDNQKALAVTALKDPDDWDLRVYKERLNPWELWLNDQSVLTPIINVSFASSNPDQSASNIHRETRTRAVYNIDCYGFAVSADIPLAGHEAGDKSARIEVQRAARLVRNIIMAGENGFLQLRGIVGSRKILSSLAFEPPGKDQAIQKVSAIRIEFEVDFIEFVDQYIPVNLEYIAIDVFSAEDGELVLEADYQYPLP